MVLRISSRKIGLSELSDSVRPRRSTLVESDSSNLTPRLAQFGEARHVEALAVHRRVVNLEVAGVDDQSGRRINRQRQRIGSRMGHAHRLDPEGSELRKLSRGRIVRKSQSRPGARSCEALAHNGQRQFAAIDRDRVALEQERQRANMIVVEMGQNHRG